ncbi:MAG: sodium:solute symporter family protein [Candidatus Marinimicrobia bacterium]|nr:sodium:solute symporter family protein [Candidatus Neomarinimicrobiota bacterium]
MHWIDYVIFTIYMVGVLSIGVYYFRKNKHSEDYYVGNRELKATHVGLSIVATDVGGGFTIGLGGVGFLMGLSGSWLLFTGLVGAWLSAVFIIPQIKKIDRNNSMMTYPDFLRFRYNNKVALVAAIISAIGYMGFTGAQILAGAKLASVTIFQQVPFGMDPIKFSILLIAIITVSYTVIGGLKAVIYTDTVQWIILLIGLVAITIPAALVHVGGFKALHANLPEEFFTLRNIKGIQIINWMITIIPIWLVGMTLYQRMFACKDVKEAKRAWYIAGIFEYPIMAFTGVFLGMCARVIFPMAEAEMAMPMLISHVLPIGVTGIVIAAYFSAIMSTADSCLMASSGNIVNDIIQRHIKKDMNEKVSMRLSMITTLIIGVVAVALAVMFQTVLDAILYAYAFMVSGLFIPTLGAYFWKRASSTGALLGMISGGSITLLLMILQKSGHPPVWFESLGLDATIYGIALSLILFIVGSLIFPAKGHKEDMLKMGKEK